MRPCRALASLRRRSIPDRRAAAPAGRPVVAPIRLMGPADRWSGPPTPPAGVRRGLASTAKPASASRVPVGLKRAATLCVLKHKERFLLLKRSKDPHRGLYTPVGGKLEPHETPMRAAVRETYEETGIALEHMKFCGTLTETSPGDYNWILFTCLAEIEDVEPPSCDEGILEWIRYDEIKELPTPTTDWFVYKYLMENKPFAFCATWDARLDHLTLFEEIEGQMVFSNEANENR